MRTSHNFNFAKKKSWSTGKVERRNWKSNRKSKGILSILPERRSNDLHDAYIHDYSGHCTICIFIMITNKKYTKLKYDGFESHLKIEERALALR